jgi:hypothetical protein
MKDSTAHIHSMCKDWKRELQFYKNEIPFFKKRLEEVASKNTSKDILAEVEHFENKFSIMATHFDELLHDVNLKDEAILDKAKVAPKYISVKMIDANNDLETLIDFTAIDFNSTRKEFYKFLSKYL